MNLMRLLYISIPLLILFSCSETEEDKPKEWQSKKVGEVTEIETIYEDGEFENPMHFKLLKELDLCGPEEPECPRCATCSPGFFRFFDIQKEGSMENLFAVQVKALTILKNEENANPTREVRVYIRENGRLVESNRLKGYIMEQITSASGIDDLMVRFFRVVDDEDTFFNCLFQWSEKDKKYKYVSVERIEGKNWGGDVKESLKKETSQQVYNELKAEGFIEGILQ